MSPFPALDPEPPPRPWWRVALAPGAVVVVVAVVVLLVVTLPGSSGPAHHPPPAARPSAPGEIIAWNSVAHTLVSMTASATLRQPSVLASKITNPPRTSPSGFGLFANSRDVYYVENRALTLAPNYGSNSIKASANFAASPFAYHENGLVGGGQGPTGQSTTPVVLNLQSGNDHPLPGAPVDQVAGDPLALGAWVSIAHGLQGGPSQSPLQPDSRIEYRTPDKAPTILTTAARIRQVTGMKNPRLELTPYPSPSGRQIAVDVLGIGQTTLGPEYVVDLTRTGKVIAKIAATNLEQLTWSSGGNRLLVLQHAGRLSTWTPGATPESVIHLAKPGQPTGWGDCIFSPDGAYILCALFSPSEQGTSEQVSRWALVRVANHVVLTEPAHEFPVDWAP